MADVQIWFYQDLEPDQPVLREPWIAYFELRDSQALGATPENVDIPQGARYAMIETDATIAYRVRGSDTAPAVSVTNCPHISATANDHRVISVSRGTKLGLVAV